MLLGILGVPEALPEVLAALENSHAQVRQFALDALLHLGEEEHVERVLQALKKETDAYALAKGFEFLLKYPTAQGADFMGTYLKDSRQYTDLVGETFELRVTASEYLGKMAQLTVVPRLIEMLDSEDALFRRSVALALGRLTNHTIPVPWDAEELPKEVLPEGQGGMGHLVEENQKYPRSHLLVKGFLLRGFHVPTLNKKAISELVYAVNDLPHISWNAQVVLIDLTGKDSKCLQWDKYDSFTIWSRLVE